MGVQGLLSYITSNPATRERVQLQHLSQDIYKRTGKKGELLCDYFSVIHWLLSTGDCALIKQGDLPPYCVLYGGDLRQYATRVVSFVKALENINIVPVFFIDGPPGSDQADFVAKFSELKSRYLKKLELGATIQQICDRNNDLLQAKWCLREGISTQVELALKSAGIRLVYCLGEADPSMIEYLQSHDNTCGILSRDTDFAVTAGSKLFLPDLFDLNQDLGICSDCINEYPEDIVCEVVTPARVASALQLRETQLADLSVLCGNDFTRNLNASLCLWAALGLSDSKVETVAGWLVQQNDSLLENEEVNQLLAQHHHYRSAFEYTYSKCSLDAAVISKANTPLVEFVHKQVKSGSMSPQLLSVVNGLYWRLAVIEPVALGQPCCNDLTLLLRKSVYSILGISSMKEYGRTASKSFTEIPLSLNFAATDGLQQLSSMNQLTSNQKLATLFYIMVNYNEFEQPSDLHEIQARALEEGMNYEGEMSVNAVVACACLLFLKLGNTRVHPSPCVGACEVEAFVVTCLACAAQLPPCIFPNLPPSRAVTLGMWFTHVLEQVYIVASCVGLYECMPQPADVFSVLSFISFYVASTNVVIDGSSVKIDSPLEDGRPHTMLFSRILALTPVLTLRSEILNRWRTPDILYLLHLFSSSLAAISSHQESLMSCVSPVPDPNVELQVRVECMNKEASEAGEDVTKDAPHFELDLDSESLDVPLACDSDSSIIAVDYGELSNTQEGRDTEECIYLSSQSQGAEVGLIQDVVKSGSATPDLQQFTTEEEVHQSYTFVDDLDTADGLTPPAFNRVDSHELPVYEHKEKILELISGHRVVCIEGETGCGKSTKIPQFILDDALKRNPPVTCKILVTQPRRVAAMKVAERVAAERKERVGKTVGFCIGGEQHRSRDTPLTYCTTGYMLQVSTVSSFLCVE